MCRYVPKVPYGSYAPDMYMSVIRDFVTHPILFINETLQKRSLIYVKHNLFFTRFLTSASRNELIHLLDCH
jgi:hypothetical protein